MTHEWAPETVVVETGRPTRTNDASLNHPITLTSTFIGTAEATPGTYGYARTGNPTWDPFEEALATLEGAALPGLVFASGLAAITAALDLVAPGGTVVVPRHAYLGALDGAAQSAAAGRFDLVPVDVADTEAVLTALETARAEKAGLDDGTGNSVLLWLESPTNPMLEVADLPVLLARAKEFGVLSVVDNTFATPLLQKPLSFGADVVVHSATKYIAGHSDVVLGAALTSREDLRAKLHGYRTIRGGIAGPFEVWLGLRGLRTMALRVERAQENAGVLARRLSEVPGIEVRYPGLPGDPGHARAAAQMNGFGAIVCLVLPDAVQAEKLTGLVELWTPATSLGGVESLIERRRRHATEPHSVPEGLVRLSVGIEHVDDLWADLEQALRAVL
ncbi:PLP-dependent aspartate aminotransferase family protein [Brevibacterium samyangense]|uniref:Aminotransferase class I/II-fold pyridoxal phosphate-dependent enzyme n=1 Tax=Brevibacterium samyangense TaxID=366888 RepID=A0ABP5EJS1_9MICO